MQIFQDYIQLKQAENSLAKLTALREQGEIDLKSFYAKKKALQATIKANKNAIKPTLQIHQEYTLSYLLQFTYFDLEINDLSDACIDGLRLFTYPGNFIPMPDTPIILDGYDDDDDEGYTQYVKEHQLQLVYNGELFIDVISSYKQYKDNFNAELMIKGLEYYSEYDNFYEFK